MSTLAAKLGRLSTTGLSTGNVHPERSAAGAQSKGAHVAPQAGLSLADRIHGPGFRQGRIAISAAKAAQPRTIASLSLDETLKSVDPARLLLVDTETTGLHGGTGTLPFVIGLAWFERESLVVRQLFVPRPGQERPLLERLAERLSRASLLVTFNGKCFDWPLLRSRFVLNRLGAVQPPPHLDLLHCARRVFKRRLGATRLQDLEAQVLGFYRHDDISGAEIPAVYFDWLRSGRTAAIERVLEHNAQDLISMAAVMVELCRRFDVLSDEDAAEDCLGVARVAERGGDDAKAREFARAAAERAHEPQLELEACALLARLAVRRREWDEAARWLERATGCRGPDVPLAHLAYARVCEHGLKDYERALKHARLGAAAESAELHARRVARLSRRLGIEGGIEGGAEERNVHAERSAKRAVEAGPDRRLAAPFDSTFAPRTFRSG